MSDKAPSITRRQFMRQAACAAVGTAGLTCAIRDLRFMNAAVAQTGINDYKALVCIFLGGGNDSNNLIIPTIQSEWNNYAAIRTAALAIPLSGAPFNIIPIFPLSSDNHDYGLHPACPELATLFGEGKLAFLFNAGTLVFPMTRAQYQSGVLQKPPQLFSHADQVTQWQTSVPNQPPLTGWGGRTADLLAAVQPNAPISLTVTLAGANTFEVGTHVSEYSVGTSGAIALSGLSPGTARYTALTNLLALSYPNLQAQTYANVAAHSINTSSVLNNAIGNTSAANYWTVPFPSGTITSPTGGSGLGTSLGPQLKMIARLIEAGNRSVANGGFGMKRQIFFCSVGGYDLHTGQTAGQTTANTTPTNVVQGPHANLFAELSQCILAFQRAMEQLGLSNNVTAFTASDFGRTFPSNSQGSDHGWGSHHIIVGGAVNGRRTYGTFPVLTVGGPNDTSTGRWIPTTAIDQYFATLATWFGVDNTNLSTVFPNLGNFATPNLGFV
ncbi:MAG: hypothetical protein C5B50_17860 [Verrucomicrobia bacterium]|nr:MAG: hypothetical protein C5B50_17860 [Verrucomicrobiota bacterium]